LASEGRRFRRQNPGCYAYDTDVDPLEEAPRLSPRLICSVRWEPLDLPAFEANEARCLSRIHSGFQAETDSETISKPIFEAEADKIEAETTQASGEPDFAFNPDPDPDPRSTTHQTIRCSPIVSADRNDQPHPPTAIVVPEE